MADPAHHPNEDGIDDVGTKDPGNKMKGLVGKVLVASNGQAHRERYMGLFAGVVKH